MSKIFWVGTPFGARSVRPDEPDTARGQFETTSVSGRSVRPRAGECRPRGGPTCVFSARPREPDTSRALLSEERGTAGREPVPGSPARPIGPGTAGRGVLRRTSGSGACVCGCGRATGAVDIVTGLKACFRLAVDNLPRRPASATPPMPATSIATLSR